jgi:hypothetical protein
MPQPGKPNPRGEDWFVRKFADLERQMLELRAANPFGLTGIDPQDGGTEFDGYANFNGNMKVTGTLELPAGIIGNDALTSPSSPYAAHADISNFALATGANVEKLALTVPVPTGFTRAHVFAGATMHAYNSNTAKDSMYMECRIQNVGPGYSSMSSAADNSIGFVASNAASVIAGISGSFKVSVVASSGSYAWPADSSRNAININVFVTFLR